MSLRILPSPSGLWTYSLLTTIRIQTGRLKLLYGFERNAGAVGRADIGRKVNFCLEGDDVEGTDVFTVPFGPNQLTSWE
jgi:hypothetical protein